MVLICCAIPPLFRFPRRSRLGESLDWENRCAHHSRVMRLSRVLLAHTPSCHDVWRSQDADRSDSGRTLSTSKSNQPTAFYYAIMQCLVMWGETSDTSYEWQAIIASDESGMYASGPYDKKTPDNIKLVPELHFKSQDPKTTTCEKRKCTIVYFGVVPLLTSCCISTY